MTETAPFNFQARLQHGDVFKKLISSILELCNECNFECTEEGMNCQSMDSSHVSLVAVNLNAQGFESYQCAQDCTLGINLTNMNKVLKCAGSKDSMTISATSNEEVNLSFENPAGDQASNFQLKLMTVDEEHLGIPETDYKCKVTMPSSEFGRITRDLKEIGESVTISATKNGVQFKCSGDIGNAEMLLKHNEAAENEKSIKIEMEEPIEQQFALRYLCSFAKSSALSSQVTLSFSDDVPLQVAFQMDDLGSIKYYLAPKIEDED